MQSAIETPAASSGGEAGSLDVWLRRTLAARFDATLEETLPPELTTLLSGFH